MLTFINTVARSAADVPTGTSAVDLALVLAAKSKAEPLPRKDRRRVITRNPTLSDTQG